MGRPPRPIKRVTVSIRFEPDEMATLDAARGSITRQDWIHGLALGVSRHTVRKAAPTPKPPAETTIARSFGPQRPKPGSRLKRI